MQICIQKTQTHPKTFRIKSEDDSRISIIIIEDLNSFLVLDKNEHYKEIYELKEQNSPVDLNQLKEIQKKVMKKIKNADFSQETITV